MYIHLMYRYLYLCEKFNNMKFTQLKSLVPALAVAVFVSACSGGSQKGSEKTAETAETETTGVSGTFAVNTETSVVAWKGEVAGVYGHNGVINVQSGSLIAEDGLITGGEIVIDMTSIQPLDTASYTSQGKTPQDLVNHLSTGDFFLVEEFPTASFTVKSHKGDQLVGDLTIRGNTSEETVTLSSLQILEDGISGVGTLVFDRQMYEVSWEHYIQDYILSDNIEVQLSIVAN